ncbi:MAG TPA: AbrB/MazE/SpoVT family DNA-binding domain-containing protein [Candidatus Dormibacteraeota bacterium]
MAISTRPTNGGRARITSQGQITVPKAVRDGLGAKAGDELEFDLAPGGYVVRLRPRRSILDFAGMAASSAATIPATAAELDELIETMGLQRALAKEAKLRAQARRGKRRQS